MAFDYIELGPVPAGEPCVQVGTDHYMAKSLHECKVYQRMLERLCPIPRGLPVAFVVRSHAHDFVPDQWDAIARSELAVSARVAELLVGHPLPEPH